MEVQKEVYRERREVLVEATAAAGLANDPASVAGLYLWLKGPESMSAYDLVGSFAELGIVVAHGDFYGEAWARRSVWRTLRTLYGVRCHVVVSLAHHVAPSVGTCRTPVTS